MGPMVTRLAVCIHVNVYVVVCMLGIGAQPHYGLDVQQLCQANGFSNT